MPETTELTQDRNRQTQYLLNDDDQLDTAEAAEFLGLAKQTLHNWRHLRRGPAYLKFSERKVNYLVRDLREFRDSHRIDPGAGQ